MRSKPLVVRSVETPDGLRCVDILEDAGRFGWAECRRDAEDSHGWRHTGARAEGFASEAEAVEDARGLFEWMDAT